MGLERRGDAEGEVGGGADVAHDALGGESGEQLGVVDGVHAVRDPGGAEHVEGRPDARWPVDRTTSLPGVDDHLKSRIPCEAGGALEALRAGRVVRSGGAERGDPGADEPGGEPGEIFGQPCLQPGIDRQVGAHLDAGLGGPALQRVDDGAGHGVEVAEPRAVELRLDRRLEVEHPLLRFGMHEGEAQRGEVVEVAHEGGHRAVGGEELARVAEPRGPLERAALRPRESLHGRQRVAAVKVQVGVRLRQGAQSLGHPHH